MKKTLKKISLKKTTLLKLNTNLNKKIKAGKAPSRAACSAFPFQCPLTV